MKKVNNCFVVCNYPMLRTSQCIAPPTGRTTREAYLVSWDAMTAKQLQESTVTINSQYPWANIHCGHTTSKPQLRKRLKKWLDRMHPLAGQSSTASASGASGKSSSTSGEEPAVQEVTGKRKSRPELLREEPPKNKVPVKDELLKACLQSAAADADGEEHLESIKETKYTVGMQFAAMANAYPNSFAEV